MWIFREFTTSSQFRTLRLFLNPYRARPWIWVYKATMETLHLQRRRHFGRSQISGGTRFTRARLTHRQQICSGSNHAGIQATKKAKARYQVSSRFYLWIKNVPSFFTKKSNFENFYHIFRSSNSSRSWKYLFVWMRKVQNWQCIDAVIKERYAI